MSLGNWLGPCQSEVARKVKELSEQCLGAYRAQPTRVEEDAKRERAEVTGAYRHRQLFELVQNGADALMKAQATGSVVLVLTGEALYCANEGAAIDVDGVTSLLHSHMSRKRAPQIGHHGIGFKSVLAVTENPWFYSRSGSFSFDRGFAAARISEVVPTAPAIPVLRQAFPVDPRSAAEADEILRGLMDWAATVVRLPLMKGSYHDVATQLKDFPSEFVLFAPRVRRLVLEDRVTASSREIAQVRRRGRVILRNGDEEIPWHVFSRVHTLVSGEARQEAEQERVPVIWAVRGHDTKSLGGFWCFFPTKDQSTLSGILNAGWKTTRDRHSLLEGALNSELFSAFADLVADSLPRLVAKKQPAAILDMLPARDAKGWADHELRTALGRRLRAAPILADCRAAMRVPSTLALHPPMVPLEDVATWASVCPKPNKWAHPSAHPKERRARAEWLGAASETGLKNWLEELVARKSPKGAAGAIRIAAALLGQESPLTELDRKAVERARIVLTEGRNLASKMDQSVFLRGSWRGQADELCFVHRVLEGDARTKSALRRLGITEIDSNRLLKLALARISKSENPDWGRVWEYIGRADEGVALNELKAQESLLRVRTIDGQFRPLSKVLLPGPVVPGDGSRDASVAVDTGFHHLTLGLIRKLGVTDRPVHGGALVSEQLRSEHLEKARDDFLNRSDVRPHRRLLKFEDSTAAGPLDPLLYLSDKGSCLYSDLLLRLARDDREWLLGHKTPDKYDKLPFPALSKWALKNHGRLRSSLGPVSIDHGVGAELTQWKELLPVVDYLSTDFDYLELPGSLEALRPEQWRAAFDRAKVLDDLGVVASFYARAADITEPPASVRCRVGGLCENRPLSEVTVTADEDVWEMLLAEGRPVLRVEAREDAARLVRRWQLIPANIEGPTAVGFLPSGPPALLGDHFPGLSRLDEHLAALHLIPCAALWLEVAVDGFARRKELRVARSGDHVYFQDAIGDVDFLSKLSEQLGLGLTEHHIRSVLAYAADERRLKLVQQVEAAATVAEKLVTLVGGRALRSQLQNELVDDVERQCGPLGDLEVAQFALALHGSAILKELQEELVSRGLYPPQRWAGSQRAREFVAELGLPAEFAGISPSERPASFDVDGPVVLPRLHDFQDQILKRISEFLKETSPGRGMLSLPTGAGKTRVVAETLVRAFRARSISGCVIWIADRNELCEQAVQAWAGIWRALGPRESLRISRLWGATGRRIVAAADQPHLVVATYQTLLNRLGPEHAWLRDAACIVVDEAHGSVAPSYSEILSWLGLDSKRTARPLIGLTATPFRGGGREVDETRRLSRRYDRRRFDHGVFPEDDPYVFLQAKGILSRVDHKVLPGVDFSLTTAQLEHVRQYRELPPSVEDWLSGRDDRNRVILEELEGLPRDWPVLVFAASVGHANLLAGLMRLRGIQAQAISHRTDPGARIHAIEAFKKGSISVLTNYGVLSTGFDAPGIRALLVARPVYSPGLYQQMIGRGLRGPLNGGKERCLIINLEDNVVEYGEQLAFRHFEHLWSR